MVSTLCPLCIEEVTETQGCEITAIVFKLRLFFFFLILVYY